MHRRHEEEPVGDTAHFARPIPVQPGAFSDSRYRKEPGSTASPRRAAASTDISVNVLYMGVNEGLLRINKKGKVKIARANTNLSNAEGT